MFTFRLRITDRFVCIPPIVSNIVKQEFCLPVRNMKT